MKSDAPTVDAYLGELPEDRREAIAAVRSVILEHLPEGFEEGTQCCVRFRRLDDVPLDVVGEAIARISVDDLIAAHEQAHR